jgi:hypothetical protein
MASADEPHYNPHCGLLLVKPEPDDAHFEGSYRAYRKAYKAWHERARRQNWWIQKYAAWHPGCINEPDPEHGMLEVGYPDGYELPRTGVQSAAAGKKRPRGQAPKVGGVACTWDAEEGCWRDALGDRFTASDRQVKQRAFFAAQKVQPLYKEQRRKHKQDVRLRQFLERDAEDQRHAQEVRAPALALLDLQPAAPTPSFADTYQRVHWRTSGEGMARDERPLHQASARWRRCRGRRLHTLTGCHRSQR